MTTGFSWMVEKLNQTTFIDVCLQYKPEERKNFRVGQYLEAGKY